MRTLQKQFRRFFWARKKDGTKTVNNILPPPQDAQKEEVNN
jgi:hypothetical protein